MLKFVFMCIMMHPIYAHVSIKSGVFRLFTKLDTSINRPANNDAGYNNVLKWDERGEIF